jgi:hypothetical protein
MKNILIILFFVLVPALSKSYTWQSICPDSIEANNIYFGAGGVICSPGGMYLWEEDIEQWIFYTYGLPVNGAAWLDGYKILVVMGNGSWSDGIYTFDLATHQFEVVAWVVTPRFIMVIPVLDQKSNLFTDEYHVGSQFGGLYRSIDGYNWTEVPYFLGKSCTAMDFYGEHLVVSETGSFTNVHWSDDYGATWQEAASPPVITDLKFNNSGELYGIFPGFSNSSGLYKSVDFGNNWEVEFWSDNMSSVGFDAIGTIFVGWESPFGGKEGIAVYDPLAPPPGLTFMNNGLASTNINKILLNPAMSNISIFCCTDSGVYMCNDYLVGENEVSQPDFQPQIYPNPLDDQHLLTINLSQSEQISAIEIFTSGGSLIHKTILTANESTNSYELDLSYLNSGVYLIRIKNRHSSVTRKFVIR